MDQERFFTFHRSDGHPDYSARREGTNGQDDMLGPGIIGSETVFPEQGQTSIERADNMQYLFTGEGGGRRRAAYDWERHKETLHRMYMNDDMTLDGVIAVMAQRHSFHPTKQQYKSKFKSWGWSKNLPHNKARWMVYKAEKRKKEIRKDTIFRYGGTTWTTEKAMSTVERTKGHVHDSITDMATPLDIVVMTPVALTVSSPVTATTMRAEQSNRSKSLSNSGKNTAERNIVDRTHPGVDPKLPQSSNIRYSDDHATGQRLLLTWEGNTLNDLKILFDTAERHRRNGHADLAKGLFIQSLEGHCHLLGPTHEETCEVANAAATFYYEQGDVAEAYRVLETIHHAHVCQSGFEHPKTQQHILQVTNLLNSWGRSTEALAFLSRAEEISQESSGRVPKTCVRNRVDTHTLTSGNNLTSLTGLIVEDSSATAVDSALNVARNYVSRADEDAGELLLTIIRRHEMSSQNIRNFASQMLQARALLLELYSNLGVTQDHDADFKEANEVFKYALSEHQWDRHSDSSQTREIFVAALELSKAFLKSGRYDSMAEKMFLQVEEKAKVVFQDYDELLIRISISIGQVYQSCRGWNAADEWFQHALSFAFESFGPTDGITRALEKALETGSFSYSNEDGRPYRVMFGIDGARIRADSFLIC